MKINAIVVVYNLKLKESTTLSTILNTNLVNIILTINVWNNGPILLDNHDIMMCKEAFSNKGIILNVYQDIRNIALSKIYNYILSKKESCFYTLFDQDSGLESDFFQNIIINSGYAIITPQVFSIATSRQIFPTYIGEPGCIEEGDFIVNKAFTISSGLTLSKKLVDYMIAIYGDVFDERFAFYGIDGSFFYRIKKLIEVDNRRITGMCVGQMRHSLAMLNESEMNEWRLTEVWYDRILNRSICTHRPKLNTFIILIKKLMKGTFRFSVFFKLISCLWYNKHPRSVYEIDKRNNHS